MKLQILFLKNIFFILLLMNEKDQDLNAKSSWLDARFLSIITNQKTQYT